MTLVTPTSVARDARMAVVRELPTAFERWNADLPPAKKKKDGKKGATP
jgi:hypothetical protein